jgi:hypothetical protein
MVRCEPDRTAELLAEPGVAPFEMRGGGMKGWLRVETAAVASDTALGHWVEVGVGYVETLPPK